MNNNKAFTLVLIVCLSAPGAILADPPRPIRDVPISLSSLDAEDFADQRITDLEDVLAALPGLQTVTGPQATDAAATQLNMRGLGTNRTLVLVDGRRFVKTPGGLDTSPDSTVDINDFAASIDRIEVLKDGASTIYGADATAGVINLVTKDDFDGIDIRASWTLPETLNILGNYSYAFQNMQECNATNGEPKPLWPYQDKHNFGMPEFADNGHQMFFGSIDYGFPPGGLPEDTPPALIFTPYYDPETNTIHTYREYNKLLQRVGNDTTITDEVKSHFYLFLGLAIGFGGKNSVSDTAYALGEFDPEGWYQDLRNAAANRTTTGGATTAPAAGQTVSPPAIDSEPQAPSTEADIAPFDRFHYPPDYAFDFSQCTAGQKDQVIKLINERDAARATMGYYMDYLRREGQSAEDAANDAQQVEKAKQLRDQKNQELKQFWMSCQMTGDAGATQATEAQSTGDATGTQGADAAARQSTADTAGSQSAAEATQQSAARQPGSCDFGGSDDPFKFNWNMEFHLYEQFRLTDGLLDTRPVPDIGIDLNRSGYKLNPALPFTDAGDDEDFFDPGVDWSFYPKRAFTDSDGRACIPLDEVSPQVHLTPDMLRFLGVLGSGEASDGQQATPPTGSTFQSTGDRLGLQLGYQYRFDRDKTPKGRDWQIGVDVGMRGTHRPTLGLRLRYDRVDSVIQEYPGLGGPGMNFNKLPEGTRNAIPDDFKYRADLGFSIGKSYYQPFTFSEYNNFNLDFLNNVPGQSGWSNNFCGNSALPPQGAGYLTKEMSPVKTLEDRWALERANVPGSDSAFIEFADPVIVGIIDTGLDWNHPDLARDNLWRNEDEIPDNGIDDDNNGYVDDIIGWNFIGENNQPWDNDGHGTFVAGLIAATRGNDIGIDGINPNARIMVLKALNTFGRTRASYIAQAIVYGADNGAKVLNLSVTGPGFPKVVQDAVDYAALKGVLVVVAAGNTAEDIDIAQPDSLRGVMTVAATGPDDTRTVFSNVGSAINIAAPGQDVVSLRARRSDFMYNSAETTYVPGDAFLGENQQYYRATGTSFAAPIVSGAASLLWSSQPNLDHRQVKRMLEQSARDIESPGRDRFTGYGLVDAQAALQSNPEFYIFADIAGVRRLDVDDQAFLQVLGVADADQFAKASLEIGQGDNPTSWTMVGSDVSEPVRIGELGRIPAEQLAGAQTWTVRVVVQHQDGQSREARYVIELE